MFQIGMYPSYGYVAYSLVIPMFTLYFMETERDNGKTWDSFFWMMLQTLISILVILTVVYGRSDYLIALSCTLQNLLLIVMLWISSKNLNEIIRFLVATLFPISTALSGMMFKELRIQGIGISLMLLLVFFGYQADMERELLNKKVYCPVA